MSETRSNADLEARLRTLEAELARHEGLEEALRQSEAQQRAILQTAGDGFWIVDADLRLLEVNEAYCRMSGYRREELLALNVWNLEASETAEQTAVHHQKVVTQGGERFETRHRRKDGSLYDVEISVQPHPQPGLTVVFLRDITERRLNEEAQERMAQLVALVNPGEDFRQCLADLTAALQDWSGCEAVGIRLQAGEDFPYFETRGFPAEFVDAESSLCTPDPDGVLPRDAAGNPVLACMCGNVLQGRFDPALPFFTPGGSFWTNSTTALLAGTSEAERQARTRNRCNGEGYESVALIPLHTGRETLGLLQFNDQRPNRFTAAHIAHLERIADNLAIALARRMAEEALRLSERRYRLLFDASPDGIAIVGQDGRIQAANLAQARMFGCAASEELIGRPILDLIHPADGERAAQNMARRLRGEELPPVAYEMIRQDGSVYHGETMATLLHDAGGAVTGYICVTRDRTEHKRAEEEHERLQQQLLQAQKMESVGRLAGGVAHDFNNMLGVIIGHTEMALDQVAPDQPLHADLEEIHKAAHRSADLTRQLLAFARKQFIVPRVIDLNEAVQGTLKMLRRLIGEDIQLAWVPGAALWPVRVDPSQIDQILANLCVNARDAIAGVGDLSIETANVLLDETACRHLVDARPGPYVRLTVSDSGCGMDGETLGHLFEPFYTTKGVGEGTGLGLATVYGIVRQNGGFIEVQSAPGRGSSFRIFLPRHGGPAEAAPEGTPEETQGGRETVLVVEDEPSLLALSQRILERLGYRVLAADTPEAAILLAETHEGTIELLLTDVVMPAMNGADLARALRGRRPSLKCLFMSGYTADAAPLLGEGACFLQKPFSRGDLAARVREALAG